MSPLTGALIGIVFVLVYLWISHRRKALRVLKELGIPGPEPNILFGNFNQVRPLSDAFLFRLPLLEEWYKKYGRVFGYYEGLRPRIVISDMEILKQVFVKEHSVFTNRPDMNRYQKSVLTAEDERWKAMRHVLTPSFSAAKLKEMIEIMESCDDIFLEVIEEKKKVSEDIEMISALQNVTLDIIVKCALAMDLDCQRSDRETIRALKDVFNFHVTPLAALRTAFPEFKTPIQWMMKLQKKQRVLDYLGSDVEGIVKARRGMDQTQFKDLLQLLMEAAAGKHEEERKLSKEKGDAASEAMAANLSKMRSDKALLSDKEIKDNAVVFLLGGYETTSTTLSYIMYRLAEHQDVQDKAYEEVQRVIGNKTHIEYQDISNLTYMQQVMDETLRVYPPVATFTTRYCKKTTKVGDLTLPGGCVVEASGWLLHRDPEYWPDPEKFDPERFSPENKSTINQAAYCPFGLGPRKCLGIRFAQLEMKLFLARVLRKYRVLPSQKTEEPLQTCVRTIMMNPVSLWLRFQPRE